MDCQKAAKKICDQVLGNNSDFQLGKTKVFLKDKQDLFLEQVGFGVGRLRADDEQSSFSLELFCGSSTDQGENSRGTSRGVWGCASPAIRDNHFLGVNRGHETAWLN